MTLGSLFDGIAGFPYAAGRLGIRTAWASEIEPSCINITMRNFPHVIHVGSITELKGDEIPPVDIISFGSPCQDLSIAGKQRGIEGARSGLFLEAVRIIREMREVTHGERPKYIIWENVPGAFSSNNGRDFRRVLSEIAESEVPMPASGRWADAGMVRGRGISIAWRVLDAQYWGVPQRRKRIYLVGDFGGQSAPEILFEPESLLGYPAEGKNAREGASENATDGIRTDNGTLGVDFSHADDVVRTFDNIAPTLMQRMGTGGNQTPCIVKKEVIPLRAETTRQKNNNGLGVGKPGDPSPTLTTQDIHMVFYKESGYGEYRETNVAGTLKKTGGCCGDGSENMVVQKRRRTIKEILSGAVEKIVYILRRFTPRECERLQGFPDDWTRYGVKGEEISDTKRYQAIGNSIAVNCADRVFRGILRVQERRNADEMRNMR